MTFIRWHFDDGHFGVDDDDNIYNDNDFNGDILTMDDDDNIYNNGHFDGDDDDNIYNDNDNFDGDDYDNDFNVDGVSDSLINLGIFR